MADQLLRDRSRNLIGKISEFGSKLWIFDAKGNRLGQYDPNINATYDASENRIGSGNLLTILLSKHDQPIIGVKIKNDKAKA